MGFKSDTFKVAGEYSGPVPFPDQHIGNFEVGEVQPTAEGGNQKVKVKVRINPTGIFGVASASLVEKHEIEEEVPVEMEVDEKKEDAERRKAQERRRWKEKRRQRPSQLLRTRWRRKRPRRRERRKRLRWRSGRRP